MRGCEMLYQQDPQAQPVMIAGHAASFDALGQLRPWTSWNDALDREMTFYQRCPSDHGYPRFVLATFLDVNWTAMPSRTDTIPVCSSHSCASLWARTDHRWLVHAGAHHPR